MYKPKVAAFNGKGKQLIFVKYVLEWCCFYFSFMTWSYQPHEAPSVAPISKHRSTTADSSSLLKTTGSRFWLVQACSRQPSHLKMVPDICIRVTDSEIRDYLHARWGTPEKTVHTNASVLMKTRTFTWKSLLLTGLIMSKWKKCNKTSTCQRHVVDQPGKFL